ncbi:MFS transporter [Gordonia sp. X0973]|uniref:MFS transporter n=1 Tax=Gordonia sp. X0973 TaxID=2742602 RepID=UPI000F52D24F|nr:MFS transporter [Gordonia sp. X0973]QKT06632.1 MFS transporter [Gordonia sp. X0973]
MTRKWWTLGVICAATFMLLLDVTIVAVALPQIQHSLGASFTALQWITDSYALALAALLLTSGSIADRFGRKRVFLGGLIVFTLGSVLCGIAQSAEMLIASRVLQGVGGAALFATSLALLAATFHGRERGIAFGVWGAVTGIATALGPVLGGVITTEINWRGVFWVNLPIGIAAIAVTVLRVDESRSPHARRVDLAGMVVFTAALLALVYGLTEAGQRSWGDALVVSSLITAAVLLIVFTVIEATVAEPMFDLSLLRVPTFVGGSIAAVTMNGTLFAMLIYVVLYLQDAQGYSAMQTGLRLLIMSVCSMVVATVSGRLSERVPVRWLIGPGLFLVGVGLLLMQGLRADSSWTHLIPGLVVAGIGSGLVNPPLASTAVGVVDVHRSGMASGINTTFRQVGIAVGIAVYGSIFSARLASGLRERLGSSSGIDPARLAGAAHNGQAQALISRFPAARQEMLTAAVHGAFADAMNALFLTSAVAAIIGAVAAAVLIRSNDFVVQAPAAPAPETGEPVAIVR